MGRVTLAMTSRDPMTSFIVTNGGVITCKVLVLEFNVVRIISRPLNTMVSYVVCL